MKLLAFPKGWDDKQMPELSAYYRTRSEDESVDDDEAISLDPEQTVMEVPSRSVPAMRELITGYGVAAL